MARIIMALLAVHLLTAFAPAPLPRTPRRADSGAVSEGWLQGEWKKVSKVHTLGNGQTQPYEWIVDSIRINGSHWDFLDKGGQSRASLTCVLNLSKRPVEHDWHYSTVKNPAINRPSWQGVIKREGDKMIVLYNGAGSERPISFEAPPSGCYLLVMQKVR